MKRTRGQRSDIPPAMYALPSFDMLSAVHRMGIAAVETPRSRARRSRKASEELPSEKSATTARNAINLRGRGEVAGFAAVWAEATRVAGAATPVAAGAAGSVGRGVSRTSETAKVASAPG